MDEQDQHNQGNIDIFRFKEEFKTTIDIYIKTVHIILSIPLIVNAGAAIALAGFFTGNYHDKPYIILALIFFLLGTVLGLFALVYDFFNVFFAAIKIIEIDSELSQENLIDKLRVYYSQYRERIKKRKSVVHFEIFNGLVSLFTSFLGIYFIAAHILGMSCYLMIAAIALIGYCIISIVWMNSRF
ncbi:TPA: hypothetical protein ACF5XO_000168 [Legionella pneumophila]|nr:hypothetical protein [Legionella pneumophila]HAT9118023.1 hypothetical protein [Legionella pneumophila subsp. pneumophila]MDW9180312.1 hypothetical protein [Legionella pneumophila]HAT1875200.1 hypothetical protein [Legionella pneumophila]HAT2074151.1 hypothetical protein [Legionella pneumophila]HAT8324690.1 hypothetical protein [Legionella pneumophila]